MVNAQRANIELCMDACERLLSIGHAQELPEAWPKTPLAS